MRKTTTKKLEPSINFTKRELQIIKLVCQQYSSKEIGEKLGLSFRTVDGYREAIHKKIKTNSSLGVLLYAIKNGIYKI